MQPLLTQQFLNQYALLNSQDREISTKANKYILDAIKHPHILENAMQMTLNRANSVKLQMLGAHLIYIKIENDCCKMELQEFLPLKQLIWARLCDSSYEKGAQNILCSIMGLLVIVLYPQNWNKFVEQMVDFMRSDINRFNYGLTILQRAAAELHNQSITRSLRIKAMKAFHQESTQLLQVFQFIIELNSSDFNTKLIAVLEEWSSVNLPLLKNPVIVEFVLTQVMSEGSIIRLGTLSTIKNALKRAFFGKKQAYDLSFNFEECTLAEDEKQSLNKITSFLIRENIWFYQALQLYQQDQDLENYIQIISTLLFSYSFLLFTPQGEEILQLPQFLFKSSFKKISNSTFNLWCSFYSLMQNNKNYAEQLHIDELASQMLQSLVKKLALTKEQIKQEINQNDQTRNFGQMGFFQYREAATQVLKAIHDFFLHYAQNQEAGTERFFNILLKHLNGMQKSIWIQLLFLITQKCFGRGLDESNYQTSKVLQILKNIFQYCGEQKERIHQLAVYRVLNTIKYYRLQISQHTELYVLALKFTIMYLTSENAGHNAALSFDRLLQKIKQEIRKDVIQEVVEYYLKHEFKSISVRSTVLQAIIKLNKNSQDPQLKLCILQKIIQKIEESLQTIHKIYLLESLSNAQPFQSVITEISILCKHLKQIELHSQNYEVLQKKMAKLSVIIINQAIEYGLKYPQSFYDYKTLVKCVKKFEQIVFALPSTMILWTCPQTLVLLLDRVFLLFQIKNLNLLLDHGKLVVIAAKLLKILAGKVINQVDLWLKQNVLRINQFFCQYYQLKCNPDFKETDPDIIRAYFTLEEAFCMYKFQLFMQQIPETILQFTILCLEKIIEKNLQKQVLSFMLNYLQRKTINQNLCEITSWLIKSLISISPILDSTCYSLLAKLLINLFVYMPHDSQSQVIYEALNSPNFDSVNLKMKKLIAQYLPFFATKASLDKTKAIFNHLTELKCSENKDEEYAESLSLIYRKWRKTLEKNAQNQEDFMDVYSEVNSD